MSLYRQIAKLLITLAGAAATFAAVASDRPAAATAPPQSAVVKLGEQLFHDPALSRDGSISCASCHRPAQAFSDGRAVALGVDGLAGTRNVPSLFDVASIAPLFWDGRQRRLDALSEEPLYGPHEHGLDGVAELEQRLQRNEDYRRGLRQLDGAVPASALAPLALKALAEFMRSLDSGSSAFDRHQSGDTAALSTQQQQGLALFRGRAGCSRCHAVNGARPALTDHDFHNHGIGSERIGADLGRLLHQAAALAPAAVGAALQQDANLAALGRYLVTRKPQDIGKFRTPSLRNVALTAPYMHDGSVNSLRAAVDHELYYSAVDRGAGFSHEERMALVAFLQALSGSGAAVPGDAPLAAGK